MTKPSFHSIFFLLYPSRLQIRIIEWILLNKGVDCAVEEPLCTDNLET